MTRSPTDEARPARIDLPGGIQVRVTSRAYPGGLRPFDHDWLHAELIVAARDSERGFRCSAFLRAGPFGEFASACADPEQKTVRFAPNEPYVALELCAGQARVIAREVGSARVVRRSESIAGAARAALADQFAAGADRFPSRGPIDGSAPS